MENRSIISNKKKTFTFLDESGVFTPGKDQDSNHYGLGIIKHPEPFELNQRLHQHFEVLCSDLKKDETRVEFSFKSITNKSLKPTLAILNELLIDNEWSFNCLYIDTEDSKYIKPESPIAKWEAYITYIKMLVRNNLWSNEETILLADFLRKPKASRKKFEFIALDIPQVYNLLQVESQGVLLLQLADILLGGYLYSLGNYEDKEGNKKRVSDKVIEIKNKVGKARFNVWKVNFKK